MATAVPVEREMRILMGSSIGVTSDNLKDLGKYFYDPRCNAAKTKVEGDYTVTSWSFAGGKEVLRVVHSDQLLYCPWYHRLSWHNSCLSSLGKNMGLDDAFALFYQIEFPMFAVDFNFREWRRVQFGQIKVSTTSDLDELQLGLSIGGNNQNKEIWNQFDPKAFMHASIHESIRRMKEEYERQWN